MSGALSNTDSGLISRFLPGAPPGSNPIMDQFGRAVSTVRNWNSMERERDELRGRRVVGDLVAQHTDPQTGMLNNEAFLRGLAANPMGRFVSPEAIAGAQARAGQHAQVQTAQAQSAMVRLDNLAQGVQGLLTRPPGQLTRDAVVAEVSRLAGLPEGQRPFTPQQAASFLSTLPNDEAGIRRVLTQQAAQSNATIGNLRQTLMPTPAVIDTGAGPQTIDVNPVTNPNAAGQYYPGQPTQGQRNDMVQMQGVDAQGRPITIWVPRQNAAPLVGGNGGPAVGTPGGPQTPRGTVPPHLQPQGPPPISGRYSPPAATGAGGQPTVPPTASAAPGAAPSRAGAPPPAAVQPAPVPPGLSGGPMPPVGGTGAPPVAALPPGVPAAMQTAAVRNAELGNQLTTAAQQIPQMTADLRNLDLALRGAPQSGPAAPWFRQTATVLNQFLPPNLRVNAEGVANQEEFNKLAAQVAQRQFAMLGGTGTDAQLASAMSTSPSEHLSRLGNQRIIALLRGNTDAMRVMNDQWQSYLRANGNDPSLFDRFQQEFQRNYDPRVFQFGYLNGNAAREFWTAMPQGERAQFQQRYFDAIRNGWIERPRSRDGRPLVLPGEEAPR